MWQALAFDITVLLLIDKALELNVLTEETLNRKVKGKGLAVVLTSRGGQGTRKKQYRRQEGQAKR